MTTVEPTSHSSNTPTDISALPPPPTEPVSSSSNIPKHNTGLHIQTNVQPQHPLSQTLPPDSATTNYRERTQSLSSTSTYNLFRSKTRVGHSTSSLQSHLSNSHSGNGEIQSRGSITSVSTPRRQNSDPSIADGSLSKGWNIEILFHLLTSLKGIFLSLHLTQRRQKSGLCRYCMNIEMSHLQTSSCKRYNFPMKLHCRYCLEHMKTEAVSRII
ncbi:hypothetical protein BKA69DRAFT_713731 [Paraphysoderma sedebokerense]|nr:hypothetical protein BKA69DRAFT_713731 [Paraphysoderma sedebokerense]